MEARSRALKVSFAFHLFPSTCQISLETCIEEKVAFRLRNGNRVLEHDCIPRIPSYSQCGPVDSVHIRFCSQTLLHRRRIWEAEDERERALQVAEVRCISQKLSFLRLWGWLHQICYEFRQCRSWMTFSCWHLTNDYWFMIDDYVIALLLLASVDQVLHMFGGLLWMPKEGS